MLPTINPKLASGLASEHDGVLQYGMRLLETSEAEGGWKEYLHSAHDIDALCRIPGTTMRPDIVKAQTAVLLENAKRHLARMDETTRALTVGGFQDYLFPIIRTAFPQNPIMDMVSVQPMTRRVGQIFFLNYKIGQAKGSAYPQGSRVFDALAGYSGGYHYTDEYVDREQIGTAAGASTVDYSTGLTALAYGQDGGGGVRPGTLLISGLDKNGVDPVIIRDNGSGVLFQESGPSTVLSSGSVNYSTGAISMTFSSGNGFAAGGVFASYEFDGEGSSNLPTLDVEISSSPVQARRRAIRYRYSTEASQDFAAEMGLNLDDTIAAGVAAHVSTEQARQVIADLWEAAGPPFASFDITYSTSYGFGRREYFADLQWPLSQTINQIYQETQRARANFMIVDVNFQNMLNTIGAPHFVAWREAPVSKQLGIQFIGVWGDNIRVYVDPLLGQLPGASQSGNALLGYKGDDIEDAGYVWAPYRLMYVTPAITLDDFVTRKAMASRYARKVVNPRMYKRFELIGG